MITTMKSARRLGVFMALLGGVEFALAQPLAPVPAGAKPSIQFEKTIHDFGKVRDTDVLRHDFIITNTGNAVLEVTDVRPGCPSCTTAHPWDRKIEPGKTGKIPIELRPKGFVGFVNKAITVTCNDALRNSHMLQVHATIWKPVEISPAYVYFVGVEGEFTNDTKIVHITNNLPEDITIASAESNNPIFKTELKTLKPGREFELKVLYTPPATSAPPQGVIAIKTSATNAPLLVLTTYAMPQPALVAMPQSIRLPAGPLSPNYRQPVTIRNNSATPVKLSDPMVSAEGVTVQTTEIQPGKVFMLNLNFPTNFHATAGKPMELTVKTSHPRYPIMRVPFILPPAPANLPKGQ